MIIILINFVITSIIIMTIITNTVRVSISLCKYPIVLQVVEAVVTCDYFCYASSLTVTVAFILFQWSKKSTYIFFILNNFFIWILSNMHDCMRWIVFVNLFLREKKRNLCQFSSESARYMSTVWHADLPPVLSQDRLDLEFLRGHFFYSLIQFTSFVSGYKAIYLIYFHSSQKIDMHTTLFLHINRKNCTHDAFSPSPLTSFDEEMVPALPAIRSLPLAGLLKSWGWLATY